MAIEYEPSMAEIDVNVLTPEITLTLTGPTIALAGVQYVYYGQLYDTLGPLAGKPVTIFVFQEGTLVATKTSITSSTGAYNALVTFPNYGDSIVRAVYGTETAEVYVSVDLQSVATYINVSCEEGPTTYETTIHIGGRLVVMEPLTPIAGQNVQIVMDGTLVATVVTDGDGYYAAAISSLSQGTHNIEARFNGAIF